MFGPLPNRQSPKKSKIKNAARRHAAKCVSLTAPHVGYKSCYLNYYAAKARIQLQFCLDTQTIPPPQVRQIDATR
jgi:hypothetical protein